jgi:hypothetical protein
MYPTSAKKQDFSYLQVQVSFSIFKIHLFRTKLLYDSNEIVLFRRLAMYVDKHHQQE